jgi:hypothetical protein
MELWFEEATRMSGWKSCAIEILLKREKWISSPPGDCVIIDERPLPLQKGTDGQVTKL